MILSGFPGLVGEMSLKDPPEDNTGMGGVGTRGGAGGGGRRECQMWGQEDFLGERTQWPREG